MQASYVAVRFEGNGSKKWDGREYEVPEKTVVRQGRWTGDGLEEAEVHWPGKGGKAKGGKIWKCVILPLETEEERTTEVNRESEEGSAATDTQPKRAASRGRWKLELRAGARARA